MIEWMKDKKLTLENTITIECDHLVFMDGKLTLEFGAFPSLNLEEIRELSFEVSGKTYRFKQVKK